MWQIFAVANALTRAGFVQWEALGYLINEALVVNDQTQLHLYKGVDGQKKSELFVTIDEAPYLSEALSFSLPSLQLNPTLALTIATILDRA